MPDFYTLVTDQGAAKLTIAQAQGSHVDLAEFAVGDGNGAAVVPAENATALVNEVWRGGINSVSQHPDNPTWLVIEAVVPTNVGGWTAREIGVFDADGDLIFFGNFPDTYKPNLANGSARDLVIKMIVETGNSDQVQLSVDPSIILVTLEELENCCRWLRVADTATYTYNGSDQLVLIEETTDGGARDTAIVYTAGGAVQTVTVTTPTHERVETFSYNPDGTVASISAVENTL